MLDKIEVWGVEFRWPPPLAILRNYPVGDTALYENPSKDATDAGALSRNGATIYRMFNDNFRLSVVLRQAGDERRPFRDLLKHASTAGSLTVDDWRLLQTRDHNIDSQS